MDAQSSILYVRDLQVSYGHVPALRGISFSIPRGETVGLLGESGCGKTTTALAILGLLPRTATATGSVRFENTELLGLSERDFRKIRGAGLSMIFQEPREALNPVMRAGKQVEEVIRAHRMWPAERRASEARGALARVGLDTRVYDSHMHQLSGGQLQRVLIAQALVCGPSLVLADEPTASLDTVTQSEILDVLKSLKATSQLSILLITHHPAILNGLAERVLVMYAGEIVESGTREQICNQPLHPYTTALLRSIPPAPGNATDKHLHVIPGEPPDFATLPGGCTFAPRCERRMPQCELVAPELFDVAPARQVRCHLYAQ